MKWVSSVRAKAWRGGEGGGGEERLAGGTCFNLGERSRIKLAGSSARSGQDFLWSLLISSPVLLLLGAGRPGCVQGSMERQGNFKASFFSPPFISTPHPVAPAVPEAHTHTHTFSCRLSLSTCLFVSPFSHSNV